MDRAGLHLSVHMNAAEVKYMEQAMIKRGEKVVQVLKDMPRKLLLVIRWVRRCSEGAQVT